MPKAKILIKQNLSNDWGKLDKFHVDYMRRDGSNQKIIREVYDRGDGAAILMFNTDKNSVILINQFRLPVYLNGYNDYLIEVPGGVLDNKDPELRIKLEVAEKTGCDVFNVKKVFESFMSPGSVTEKIHFFTGEYNRELIPEFGGIYEEGEDIGVTEVLFPEAMRMIERGEIVDAKTILLLQYAYIKGILTL